MSTDTRHNYVIVGSGSAGAALARRLADAGQSVLLLEAGKPRHKDFWVRVPIGIAKIVPNKDYVWQFHTEPQSGLVGQRIYWPRGRLPGGSSSVNGMIFSRGDPLEFDHWESLGNKGWGWKDLLPYFIRLESCEFSQEAVRGRNGPISIQSLGEHPDRLSDAFLHSCLTAGIPRTADYNGGYGQYGGVSYLQLSTRRGVRSSTAVGYLENAPSAHLELRTNALATQILFEGRRAVGVEYLQDGQHLVAHANLEVILAAGPIKSPQLLELSGIGDGDRLRALGIETIHHLPGVGENLSDHLQSRITFEARHATTLNQIMGNRLRKYLMGAAYMIHRHGLMATPSCTVHALAASRHGDSRPDVKLQIHHLSSKDRLEVIKPGAGSGLDPFPGFSIGFFQLRPSSRGSVHASSRNPLQDPVIEPNYLSADEDRATVLRAIRLARLVIDQPAMAPYVVRETRPGINICDDEGLLHYIQESGQTSFHPVGTCRMGSDELAVVDASLRVHGITGLRVVDSSVMPTIPSSNTNAASILVGEKAADLILLDSRGHAAPKFRTEVLMPVDA